MSAGHRHHEVTLRRGPVLRVLPSARDVAVFAVDAAAAACEALLDRLDAAVCRTSNELSPSEED